METNTEKKQKQRRKDEIGSSSEDELLASSQETVVSPSGSGNERHSTLLPSKSPTNTPQSDAKAGDNSRKKRPKRKSQKDILKARYTKAVFILDKIAKNAANGTPHERDEDDRVKYQAVVDEYQKSLETAPNAWVGLSLKLIPAEEIPMRPRARVWLPKMSAEAPKMLECLKRQNPNIHMNDWAIIRTEQGEGLTCLILAITEAGSVELEKVGFRLFFGVRGAKVKVFRPTKSGSEETDEMEAANSLLTGMKLSEPPDKPDNGTEDSANLFEALKVCFRQSTGSPSRGKPGHLPGSRTLGHGLRS
ncbi:uncharacterized protein LOC119601078 [Lucilia sericata]|uniref:uncharacterized protein LOC119601078 n=1 Tax=Lucilia sericata TaxID=13632 RepID=UPI0018A7F4F4|nr:uncharacterized protein LOC119601078 [Lucilia sericata]